MPDDATESITAQRLRLGLGFAPDERAAIVERIRRLDRPLAAFGADRVDHELSVAARGTRSQRVLLDCLIAGWPRPVATSIRPDLDEAVDEACDELLRQLDGLRLRTEQRGRRAAH